jgi:enoyl-CoA hydratase/carnithine racemase
MPDVLYERDGHVATIVLNRPDRMNALTFDMADEFREALHRAEHDAEVRALILTGAGKAFCAGDDVEAAWGDPRMAETVAELSAVRPPTTPEAVALLDFTKPIIAAVNGVAVGWGMDVALLADIIVASDRARFGQFFVKMGLSADVAGLWKLPQLVGVAKATELLLTGDLIDAAEAERIGLVSSVVPHDDLLPTVNSLAERIAANPPLAVQYIKEGLRRGVGRGAADVSDLGAFVGTALARLFQSEDHKEAAQAFIEKRTATFTGR